MNQQQAKEILSAYRPGTDDEGDPMFREALQMAQRDRELADWFQERKAFDEAVKRRLAASSLPPALPDELLSGMAQRRQSAHRRRTLLAALAACLVFSVTLTAFWLLSHRSGDSTQFALCRHDMIGVLKRFPHLDLETANLSEARGWLAETHHLQQIQFPAGLERFPTIGCRTLEWRGRSLALVCFVVDGEVVHLILIPRSEIPDGPLTSELQFARESGTSVVAWSRGDLTYLVLTKAGEDFLRKRL